MRKISVPDQEARLAFTLAEVLITLGIIGIVAALTMPVISAKVQKNVLKNQFKKAYAVASQALLKTQASLGVDNLHQTYGTYDFINGVYTNSGEFIREYNKQLKVIGNAQYKEGYPLNYNKSKKIDTRAITCIPTNLLPDGSSVCTQIWSSTISVTTDINGPKKGPNAFGHDIFMFRVAQDKPVLIGQPPVSYGEHDDELTGRLCSKTFAGANNGLACGYYALIDECPDDSSKHYFECLP